MSTIYEPDFGGHIGRTHRDSTPWWPPLPEGLGKSNVVMIVLDDLGFAHFGAYGSTLTSPNVDRLGLNKGFAATRADSLKPGNTGNWGVGPKPAVSGSFAESPQPTSSVTAAIENSVARG